MCHCIFFGINPRVSKHHAFCLYRVTCITGTHSTKACRRYANFVKGNLIASSRRTTPVQEIPRRGLGPVQNETTNMTVQQANEPDQRQLFPHPPTQWFQPPGVPPVEKRKVQWPSS